jgi:class 3 adenylate cyclase
VLNLYKPRRQLIAKAVDALETYGVSAVVRETLTAILDEQRDRELFRANPGLLAAHMQLELRTTLQILVMGVREGIFILNWEVECPVCGGLDPCAKGLSNLTALHTCPMCNHIHETDADHSVRVTFSVDERLRKLGADADDADFRARMDRRYGVVTAHQLLTLQLYRRLFPREVLPPNESLRVRRVAILFTDLVGSTALYSRQGDTKAYELVRQHFDLLFRIMDEHRGVVVKTIGDAVMGAFTRPMDAIQAAIAMHQHLQQLNHDLNLEPQNHLILKIGIDAGPCISVTLNDRPDYFGTIVNTAARVEASSQGNYIAVTDGVIQDAEVREFIQSYPIQQRAIALKGLGEPSVIHYIQPHVNLLQTS